MASRERAVPAGPAQDVTSLLLAWRQGDESALSLLVTRVHGELRRVARRYMTGERQSHSLQPTALVNELYVRLVDVRLVNWQDRAHFFAMSARLMRRILVDHARHRQYLKRGGGARCVSLDDVQVPAVDAVEDLVALDEALDALASADKRMSRVVELRYFAGLSVAETAAVLGVSPDTVMRDWKFARVWLLRHLARTDSERH